MLNSDNALKKFVDIVAREHDAAEWACIESMLNLTALRLGALNADLTSQLMALNYASTMGNYHFVSINISATLFLVIQVAGLDFKTGRFNPDNALNEKMKKSIDAAIEYKKAKTPRNKMMVMKRTLAELTAIISDILTKTSLIYEEHGKQYCIARKRLDSSLTQGDAAVKQREVELVESSIIGEAFTQVNGMKMQAPQLVAALIFLGAIWDLSFEDIMNSAISFHSQNIHIRDK